MGETIARFVVRDSDDASDGLLLGAIMQCGAYTLHRGGVYELRVILGEATLVYVGQTALATRGAVHSWAADVSTILAETDRRWLMTAEEWEAIAREFEQSSARVGE